MTLTARIPCLSQTLSGIRFKPESAMEFEEELSHFDAAAERMIELGNELLDQDADSDSWEVASGL